MSDDPHEADALLSTCQLASKLRNERGACRSNRETITRWIHRGVKVHGKRVRLKATRQGGLWVIRWADFVEFRETLTTRATHGELPRIETPAAMRRRAQRAREEMESIFAEALGEKRETGRPTRTTTRTTTRPTRTAKRAS